MKRSAGIYVWVVREERIERRGRGRVMVSVRRRKEGREGSGESGVGG